jgi:hypothetical protein
VNELRRTYLDVVVALGAWRAARDAEALVALWVATGEVGSGAELVARRRVSRKTRVAHERALRRYRLAVARGAA